PQRVVLQALQAASAVLQGVGTGHPPPQEVRPFQELRHQFAFVYPFSDVLPLYNQKIYAKDTAKKRVKTDPTHASVKVKLNPKGKENQVLRNANFNNFNKFHLSGLSSRMPSFGGEARVRCIAGGEVEDVKHEKSSGTVEQKLRSRRRRCPGGA
ncbi:hypothetical protein PF001_g14124, partial [Phytophthora fragariae]